MPSSSLAHPSLSQLRDIHLPDPISIWPPAPGWYLAAILIIAGFATGYYFLYRYWRNNSARRMALKQLTQLEQRYHNNPASNDIVAELSILLRRLALAYFPRNDIAGLQGSAWLDFLNKTAKTTLFSAASAEILTLGPYQKQSQQNLDEVFIACKQWIKKASRYANI